MRQSSFCIKILHTVSLFCRQLLKDFDKYAYAGFWFASFALPMVLAKKEDVMGQDTFSGDVTDPEIAKMIADASQARLEEAIANEPQAKIMVGGCFLDMIRRGVFKMN